MEAAFLPEVKDELDTQNFEKFEEVLVSLQMGIYYLLKFCLVIYGRELLFNCFMDCSLNTMLKLRQNLVHGERYGAHSTL